ncbi:bifunctional 5,10-methylenetetrahydrofolate dehydrogenase/5,10-methenyltetrahydrofolate cyclohydrolase [Microbacteriaceae bacterium]|nr:bifunctional 5,10-methylenetetrahydrofolate dehydrogenase/5,10-methenyltetrahydrofolate cyclohydrolase [Candidatus Saccharibacteria bacterium]
MTRFLNGLELQGFIEERQAKQVRNLRQEHLIIPKLLIIMSESSSSIIDTYVRMKQRYANEVLIEVEVCKIAVEVMPARIAKANADETIHGIIIQLPLDDPSKTEEFCNMIAPEKDVDGLGTKAEFPSATAEAIDWLLTGYNVDLGGKKIAIVGHGKLVGQPLARMWSTRGLDVTIVDENSENVSQTLLACDVIVTATGVPRLLTSDMLKQKAVIVDAGTASENGTIVGDVDVSTRESRTDLTITPIKGGVGPLTIAVLFDHIIQACLKRAGKL